MRKMCLAGEECTEPEDEPNPPAKIQVRKKKWPDVLLNPN